MSLPDYTTESRAGPMNLVTDDSGPAARVVYRVQPICISYPLWYNERGLHEEV